MLHIGKPVDIRRTEQRVSVTYLNHQRAATARVCKRYRSFVVIAILCTVSPLTAIFWTMPAWLADINHYYSTHPQVQQAPETPISRMTSPEYVPYMYSTETTAVAHQYMDGLFSHNYAAMWSLLSPDVQAMWPGETAFATYWQNRFQGYTLQQYSVGSVQWLTSWVNPETMRAYSHVLTMPVSLVLTPGQATLQDALAPPEDLYPAQLFQNLPFIVQPVTDPHDNVSHWLILNGGPADLEAPILPPLYPTPLQVHVPILMYHHIFPTPAHNQLMLSLTVTPTLFAQQLDYLAQQNYHTITFNQLFDALYYGGPLPTKPIILTFDDGYQDVYQFAFPLLQAHNFSGMFYIVTGKVGWNGYMTWNELRSLYAGGMQIGSHTVHHLNIGAEYLYSPPLAQEEAQQSQATLQQNLGILIQQFCYPSGEPFKTGSLFLQLRVMAMLAADGYVGATTDPGRTGTYQSSLLPLDLLRVRVDGRNNLQTFENSLLW